MWKDAALVLTDSGGHQEETTALGVPCLTLRENTERPITVAEGTNISSELTRREFAPRRDEILGGDRRNGPLSQTLGWACRRPYRCRHARRCFLSGSMFRCPSCHAALDETALDCVSQCPVCKLPIENVEGIPLLVRDRQTIEATIAEAKRQGLDAWYTKPHLGQWTGPYRHHIMKRKQWVEGALRDRAARHGGRRPSAST